MHEMFYTSDACLSELSYVVDRRPHRVILMKLADYLAPREVQMAVVNKNTVFCYRQGWQDSLFLANRTRLLSRDAGWKPVPPAVQDSFNLAGSPMNRRTELLVKQVTDQIEEQKWHKPLVLAVAGSRSQQPGYTAHLRGAGAKTAAWIFW